MPLYDYECAACGAIVELMHGVNDSGPSACRHCGAPMRKLMSAPAIVFKGSGWAKKDARESSPAGSRKTDGADKKGDTPASDGADGKPAAATTDKAAGSDKASSGASAAD
jgi:putative FmdB family regulatory protein